MPKTAHVSQYGTLLIAERNNLATLSRIRRLDIFDHHRADSSKVDIKVRHRDAFGVEKTLEQQSPSQRVKIGTLKPATREPAPGPSTPRDTLIFSPLNEI